MKSENESNLIIGGKNLNKLFSNIRNMYRKTWMSIRINIRKSNGESSDYEINRDPLDELDKKLSGFLSEIGKIEKKGKLRIKVNIRGPREKRLIDEKERKKRYSLWISLAQALSGSALFIVLSAFLLFRYFPERQFSIVEGTDAFKDSISSVELSMIGKQEIPDTKMVRDFWQDKSFSFEKPGNQLIWHIPDSMAIHFLYSKLYVNFHLDSMFVNHLTIEELKNHLEKKKERMCSNMISNLPFMMQN